VLGKAVWAQNSAVARRTLQMHGSPNTTVLTRLESFLWLNYQHWLAAWNKSAAFATLWQIRGSFSSAGYLTLAKQHSLGVG
jgi:membrane protein required for beta-lactamase induction